MSILTYDIFRPNKLQNLAVWLDATDLATITKDGSNVVSTVGNKGLGSDFTAYGTADVTYNITGLNGNPAFVMPDNAGLTLADEASLDHSTFSLFVVFQRDVDAGSDQGIIRKFGDAGTREFFLSINGSDQMIAQATSDGTTVAAGNTTVVNSTGTAYIMDLVANGTNKQVSVNNANTATIAQTTCFNGTSGFDVGQHPAGGYLQGRVSEVLFYTASLSAAQRSLVLSYLSTKWGVST